MTDEALSNYVRTNGASLRAELHPEHYDALRLTVLNADGQEVASAEGWTVGQAIERLELPT